MVRSVYRLPLESPDDHLLVLDARGTYGDDVEWSLRDSANHLLRTLSIQEALILAATDAPSVISATQDAADEMEAAARQMAHKQHGMDDNVRDLWQTVYSLRAELDRAVSSKDLN